MPQHVPLPSPKTKGQLASVRQQLYKTCQTRFKSYFGENGTETTLVRWDTVQGNDEYPILPEIHVKITGDEILLAT